MLSRIFPRSIDNTFRGHWLALWLFGFYIAIKVVQGTNSIVLARETAVNADGLPLASYGPAAADTVVGMFALLGLNLIVVPLLGVLALLRYRAMVPLLQLVFLLLFAGNRLVHSIYPIGQEGGVLPVGFYVNVVLIGILTVSFVLALLPGSREA